MHVLSFDGKHLLDRILNRAVDDLIAMKLNGLRRRPACFHPLSALFFLSGSCFLSIFFLLPGSSFLSVLFFLSGCRLRCRDRHDADIPGGRPAPLQSHAEHILSHFPRCERLRPRHLFLSVSVGDVFQRGAVSIVDRQHANIRHLPDHAS